MMKTCPVAPSRSGYHFSKLFHFPLTMSKGKALDLLIMKSNTVQFNFHQPAAEAESQAAPEKSHMPKSGAVPLQRDSREDPG